MAKVRWLEGNLMDVLRQAGKQGWLIGSPSCLSPEQAQAERDRVAGYACDECFHFGMLWQPLTPSPFRLLEPGADIAFRAIAFCPECRQAQEV